MPKETQVTDEKSPIRTCVHQGPSLFPVTLYSYATGVDAKAVGVGMPHGSNFPPTSDVNTA